MKKQILQQHSKIPAGASEQLLTNIEPLLGYVDGFCTQLFNSFSVHDIEEAITGTAKLVN